MDAKGRSVEPHLAHAWDVDASRTAWTFYLRKGVLFHHGHQMVAEDVRYSLERLRRLAPKGLYSWAYAGIADMQVVDDYTIRIRLAARNEAFLAFLSTNRAAIVPQELCETVGEAFGRNPVGTGPFRLAGNEHGVWQLEVFPAYFQGRGFLDRVEVWAMPENSAAAREAHLPTFQVMHNVRISSSAERWQQVRQSGMTCKFITVNELKEGVMRNERIRAALNAAINRLRLLELLSGDVIEMGDSFWPEMMASGPNSPAPSPIDIEPEAIERELEAAGYRGEALILATIPQYETDARFIQQLCASVGIRITTKLIPAEQFKGEARMSADLLLFAIMLDEHRELRLIDLYKSLQQHLSPDMQHWLETSLTAILAEPDPALRTASFQAIEDQLKSRSSLLFLYRKHLKTAFHPNVRGIALESLSWVRFRDLWFV
nr:ABC transporter substrate-binding protein [Paenibacillus phyllosphaerae]